MLTLDQEDAHRKSHTSRVIFGYHTLTQPKVVHLFARARIGDIFNPSIMSTVTKGVQMIPVLEELKVCVCVYEVVWCQCGSA